MNIAFNLKNISLFPVFLLGVICFFSFQVHAQQNTLIRQADSLLKINELDKAQELYFEVLSAQQKVNQNDTLKAKVWLGLARYYHMKSKLDSALGYYLQALDQGKKLSDQEILTDANMGIGVIHSQSKGYDQAIDYLKEAARTWDKEDVKRLQVLINLGNVYLDSDHLEETLQTYDEALALAEKLKAEHLVAIIHTNLSNYYTKIEDWNSAMHHAHESVQIREKLGQPLSVKTLNNLGYAYVQIGDIQEGIRQYRLALSHATPIERQLLLSNLKDAMIKIGDYRSAHFYFEEYDQLKDSLSSLDYEKRIAELSEHYRSAEKAQRIEVLEYENKSKSRQMSIVVIATLLIVFLLIISTLLWLKNDRFKREIAHAKTRDQLIRSQLNPHFIFNALQNIQHYVFKNDSSSSMEYLSSFSRLMRLILEQSNSEWVKIESELEMLRHYLLLQQMEREELFEYVINIEDDFELDQVEIPALLIQPFVENAVKHGIKDRKDGKIKLTFSHEKDVLKVSIMDNGRGLSTEETSTYDRVHKSMGMELLKRRIAEINKQYPKLISLDIRNAFTDFQFPGTLITLQIKLKN